MIYPHLQTQKKLIKAQYLENISVRKTFIAATTQKIYIYITILSVMFIRFKLPFWQEVL